MEIKEGMYVRTNDGYIGKLLEIRECPSGAVHANTGQPVIEYTFDSPMWDSRCTDGCYDDCILDDLEIKDIISEPSYEIFDLIKPGDYINGSKVIRIGCKLLGPIIDGVEMDIYNGIETEHEFIKYVEDIESVVTKEQFKRAAYEVRK